MYTTLVAPEGINITEQVISKGVLNEQTLRGILHHLPQIVTAQWGTLWIFSALETGCVDFFNGRYITSARTNSGKFGIDAVHSLLSLRSGLFEYVQSTVSKRIPCTSFSLDTRRVLELANMLALNSCVEHNSRVPDSCNLIIADPLDPSCDYPHANLESVVELYKLDELALARVLCCTPTAHTPPSDQSVVDLLQQESAVPVLNSWYPPIASESFQAYTSNYKFEQSGAEFEAFGDFVDSGDLLLTEEEIEAAVCDLANYELYAAADYDSDYQFELDQLNLKLSAQQASSCKKFLTVKEERACRVRRPRRVGKMLLPVSQKLRRSESMKSWFQTRKE